MDDTVPYQTQLKKVGELLLASKCTEDEVVEELGNSIAALFSVPTAIYCFLRAQTDIPGIQVKYFKLQRVNIVFKCCLLLNNAVIGLQLKLKIAL